MTEIVPQGKSLWGPKIRPVGMAALIAWTSVLFALKSLSRTAQSAAAIRRSSILDKLFNANNTLYHAIKAAFCASSHLSELQNLATSAPQRCIWLRTALAAASAALRNISRRRTDAKETCGRAAIRRSHNVKRPRQMWSIIG